MFSIGGNFTYQDLKNKVKTIAGTERTSQFYNVRMPNIPYMYANSDISVFFQDVFGKGNVLMATHNMHYVAAFTLNWETLGEEGTRSKLPTQISHDAGVTYSMRQGRYNVSFEARNITDRWLYDNFGLQKPGRNFSVKFRYFIKSNK